jgi:hypothetical protein
MSILLSFAFHEMSLLVSFALYFHHFMSTHKIMQCVFQSPHSPFPLALNDFIATV